MRLKYQFGEFELNPASRELSRNGEPVALRPRALECLIYLIAHRDRAVGRDELIAAVWGRVDASDTVVAQTMLRARKALDDTGDQQLMIRTVPRFGYRWVAPVREVAASPDSNGDEVAHAGESVPDAVPSASMLYAEADTESHVDEPGMEAVEAGEVELSQAFGADIEVAETSPESAKRRRLLRIGGSLLLALIVMFGLGYFLYPRHRQAPAPIANDAVLVMPVAVAPMDSESAWVRLGAMDYMATRLRASGVNVLPSEQAMRLSAAIEGDAPAVVREKLLSLSGARWIAVPEARWDDKGWLVRLRLFDAGAERWVEARGGTALAAAAEAADVWLRQLDGQAEAGPPPSPQAERLQRIDAETLAGRLQEARRLLRSSSPTERSDPRFLYREARIEFRASNLDGAADLFQRALDQAPDADVQTKVYALQGLGGVERYRNNLDAAELRFNQILALQQTLPPDRVNSRMAGLAYQGLGIIRAQRGDLDAAIKYLGQARVWTQRSGDFVTLAVIGHNLGKVEVLRGDYLQALREFDRSIGMFERFRVNDYLANTLYERAQLQLVLARPADAWESVRRAGALLPKLEDNVVVIDTLATKARVQLALGRLRDAEDTLSRIGARGVVDTDPRVLEQWLRLRLARNQLAEARKLAASGPSSAGASDGTILASVQAALRGGDIPLAQSWLSRAVGEREVRYHAVAQELARALIARTAGEGTAALQHAGRAVSLAGSGASPEAEIQIGVMQVLVLLDTRQYEAATAIVGSLEKYAETDYRVAWVMARFYRALGDQRAAASAVARANALRGERDLGVEPVL